MKNYIAYGISIIVIVISVCLVILLPINQETKTMFSLPGIAGLFSLLTQGWRDQVAHERALELQNRQHGFDLAIASHMANVVFDKQVIFCEEYSLKLNSIVRQMIHDGPSRQMAVYVSELREIRAKYSPWISKELSHKILPFESALMEVYALSMMVERAPNQPDRTDLISRMYKIHTKFLGIDMEMNQAEPESAADIILEHFADILNIFDLEILRRSAINAAKSQLKVG